MTKLITQIVGLIVYIAMFAYALSLSATVVKANELSNEQILVKECPVEIVEVEVPVYIPNGSASVYDTVGRLYLYDTEVWNGPRRASYNVPYIVLEYFDEFEGEHYFKLERLE